MPRNCVSSATCSLRRLREGGYEREGDIQFVEGIMPQHTATHRHCNTLARPVSVSALPLARCVAYRGRKGMREAICRVLRVLYHIVMQKHYNILQHINTAPHLLAPQVCQLYHVLAASPTERESEKCVVLLVYKNTLQRTRTNCNTLTLQQTQACKLCHWLAASSSQCEKE